jgi:hypothetical protein
MPRRPPLLSEAQANCANAFVNRLEPEKRPVFWSALVSRLSLHPSDAEVARCCSLIFEELRRGEILKRAEGCNQKEITQ